MAHVSEKRWPEVRDRISGVATQMVQFLGIGEEVYLQLLEVYAYAGNDDTEFARQLFETATPTAAQITMVVDAKNALVACHDLYSAASNQTVPAADRLQLMRKMI